MSSMTLDFDILYRNFSGIIIIFMSFLGFVWYFRRDALKLAEDVEKVCGEKIRIIEQEIISFSSSLREKNQIDDDDKTKFITLSYLLSDLEILKDRVEWFIDDLTDLLKKMGILTAILIISIPLFTIVPSPEQDVVRPVVIIILIFAVGNAIYKFFNEHLVEYRKIESKINQIKSVRNINELEEILIGD